MSSQAGQPLRCIYCQALLTATTRPAHVWPEALGGRLSSRRICCDDCNNSFAPLENEVAESLRLSNALLGARRGDGTPIEAPYSEAGVKAVISEGTGDMQPGDVRFEPATRKLVVPLPAGLENQARRIAKALRKHGPDVVDNLTLEPEPIPIPVAKGIGPWEIDYTLTLGGTVEFARFGVKVALDLLACFRHDLAIRGELSQARSFARRGIGSILSKIDPQSEGSGLLSKIDPKVTYHAIETWTCRGSVFYRITFLRSFVFTATLATGWKGEAFRATFAFPVQRPSAFLVKSFRKGDGPNLAIWHAQMKVESEQKAKSEVRSVSWDYARTRSKPEPEAPPDLDTLKQLVRAKLTKK